MHALRLQRCSSQCISIGCSDDEQAGSSRQVSNAVWQVLYGRAGGEEYERRMNLHCCAQNEKGSSKYATLCIDHPDGTFLEHNDAWPKPRPLAPATVATYLKVLLDYFR